ncbi:polysaccharide deacetylase family protein [Halomarina pelagica]|uniref:polysaccharide deacetylase family protein n=1 Tax=Halomarina pelagica TaxID=2961599 RepID=UPI0020C489BC|nr:polysaccharide deacetylase family protein [Halomarina sp. BND7]
MSPDRRRTTRRAFLATGALALGSGCTGLVDTESTRPSRTNGSDRTPGGGGGSETGTDAEAETETPDSRAVSPPYLGRYFSGGRLVDDMSDLSRWSGEGTIVADPDVRFGASQSLRYEGRHQMVLIGDYADDPIDLSDAALSFASYFERPANSQPTFTLTAYAPDDDNWVEFGYPYIANKDLRWQRFDLAPTRTKGSPDLSNVTKLVFMMYAGNHRPIRLWLDDLRAHPKPDRGKLIFRFDDSHRHHYTDYFTTLQEYGYPAVEAVVKREIGRRTRLTVPHLHEMQDAGWDLCNHTTAHQNVTEFSEAEFRANIEEMNAFFDDIGITRGTNFLVRPYGAYDGTSITVADEHFDLAFGGSSPTNYALTNPLQVGADDVHGDLESAKELVDLAVEHRSLSIPLFHRFEGSKFEKLVEYVHRRERAGELDVITASDLWEHLQTVDRW